MSSHPSKNWKDRLYAGYVSSGQAIGTKQTADANTLLKSRAPYIRALIANHIPADKQTRVVDLGCGFGPFLHFLNAAGYDNISGVDVSAEQVLLAAKLNIAGVTQGDLIPYLNGLPDQSVDVFLLMDILEHLSRPELFEVLDQVLRVLAPGGRCIAHVPNASGIFGTRVRYADLTHELSFTPKSMRQLMRTVGFQSVTPYEDKPLIYSAPSFVRRMLWATLTIPSRLLHFAETGELSSVLSANMLIVSQK